MKLIPRDHAIFMDIETTPEPVEVIQRISPWDGEAWIREETASITAHKSWKAETKEKKIAGLADQVAEREQQHYRKIQHSSCLDPLYSRVLCITLSSEPGQCKIVTMEDEASLLTWWWREMVPGAVAQTQRFITWNGYEFDLPFLLARTRILDLTHEITTTTDEGHNEFSYKTILDRGGYWAENLFMDLRQVWAGKNRFAKGTLDQVAKAMGHVGKSHPSGELVWQWWQKDRDRAREYIRTEMQAIRDVAESMGVYF